MEIDLSGAVTLEDAANLLASRAEEFCVGVWGAFNGAPLYALKGWTAAQVLADYKECIPFIESLAKRELI